MEEPRKKGLSPEGGLTKEYIQGLVDGNSWYSGGTLTALARYALTLLAERDRLKEVVEAAEIMHQEFDSLYPDGWQDDPLGASGNQLFAALASLEGKGEGK